MNKRIFFKNTAIMTVTSLLLRLLGILFRVFISNRVGAEGMGLYQLVFSVYVLGATFANSGIITAVTRLAAERLTVKDTDGVRRLMRISSLLCLTVGGISALVLYGAAPYIGALLRDTRAVASVSVSGIALPFIGVSGCIKGYFMARRRAAPPCYSQLLEQTVRIGGILWALTYLWDGSTEQACVIIILGDALSEAVACVYLLGAYRKDTRHWKKSTVTASRKLLRPLLHISLPLTAGRYLSTALRTVESFLVPARLTMFTHSESLSLAQFGAVKGMALPLIFFPSALLMTLSGLLIPELSDAYALHQQRQVTRLVERTLRITLLGSILVGGLFTLLGKQLGEWLYHDSLVGLLLQILGPLTPIMYLDSMVAGMLKGLGQQVHALWFGVADSLTRILLIWFLLPRYGLTGFMFVMIISNLLTASLNTQRLLTVSHTSLRWLSWILCPLLSAVISGWICGFIPNSNTLLYGVVVGSGFTVIYCICLFCMRCVTKNDIIEWFGRRTESADKKTATV